MSPFAVFTKKEFTQLIREMKVVWLPLVFMLLGMTQPAVTYFLPDLLKTVGGSEGITVDPDMASQEGGEVLAGTLGSQFDQLGVMILVISLMGIIQSEKVNGMLDFILTRPVSVQSYISGKVTAHYLFAAISMVLGYGVSYLYVYVLFTSIPFFPLMVALGFYLLWVLFIVAFTMMISAMFRRQSVIALIAIGFLLGLRVIVGVSSIVDDVNPASMSAHAMDLLMTGVLDPSVFWSMAATLLCTYLSLHVTIRGISNKQFRMKA